MLRAQCIAVVVLVSIPAAFVHLRAQTPADVGSATIHVDTNEVAVDVTVTGRKDVSRNLTTKDFSVWEDGKIQKINSVNPASVVSGTHPKHFAIYFDFTAMSLPDQQASKESATDFIDGMARPDRYMAIMSWNAPGGPSVLQNFIDAAVALKNAVMSAHTSSGERVADAELTVRLANSLATVCLSMSSAPGRKALLLFTGGFYDANAAKLNAFRKPIAACNRANVAIYAITGDKPGAQPLPRALLGRCTGCNGQPGVTFERPGDVQVVMPTDPSVNSFAQLLAEGTGGETLNVSVSLKDRLAEVAREQDEYYEIFYTPPAADENSCHTLRVAMNPRGLTARARSEYCTQPTVQIVADRISVEKQGSGSTAGSTGMIDVTMQLPYFYTGTNQANVLVSADLLPAGVKFEKTRTGIHGQIDLVGTLSRPDGSTVSRFADTVNIDLADQNQAEAFGKTPYHYEQQFAVSAGEYVFRLAAGALPNIVGKAEAPLYVEPWNSSGLGIGGMAFSTEARPVDQGNAREAPVLEGGGALVAGGSEFTPAATNRFGRSGQIYFYTEVYDPALGSTKPSEINRSILGMEYRILDAKTGDVKQDSGVNSVSGYIHPGNPLVPFATRLTVAQLPPGSYRLEVRAGIPSTQETVTRTVEFELK